MGFVASSNNWMKFVDAVMDKNPIHRDSNAARNFGFRDIVAPGMWSGQHVCLKNIDPRSVEYRFKSPVYNGDSIQIREDSLYKGAECVCSYKISSGVLDKSKIFFPESFDYIQRFRFDSNARKNLSESFGINEGLPGIVYLASLAAPTLLEGAKSIGVGEKGLHLSQSIKMTGISFDFEDIKVFVKKGRSRGDTHSLDLYWVSGKDVVASGKSLVKTISN